jgi:nitrogenase iron protein NifH
LGDVVCGGFAVPIREGIAEHVFTVSSSDFMSIYASNNLMKGIEKYSNSGGALFGGIIANSINTSYQKAIIDDFVKKTSTQVVEYVPRSITVTQAELSGHTTIEAAPKSQQAEVYRNLARKIAKHTESRVPTPLETDQLREWSAQWADQLLAIEAGEVRGEKESI